MNPYIPEIPYMNSAPNGARGIISDRLNPTLIFSRGHTIYTCNGPLYIEGMKNERWGAEFLLSRSSMPGIADVFCAAMFFLVPCNIFAHIFPLPSSRNSDPRSHSRRLSSPLPTTVRNLHFFAEIRPFLFPRRLSPILRVITKSVITSCVEGTSQMKT